MLMQKSIAILLVAVFAAFASDARAVSVPGAGGQFILNFDENGNGSVNPNNTGLTPDNGQLLHDPSQPGAHMVLTYFLPALVTNGDVNVFEGNTVDSSDGLRFTDASGHLNGASADRMLYYSLPDQVGVDGIADVPALPGNWNPFAKAIENLGAFSYVPDGGTVYNGISDVPTPEPSTLVLGGLGLISLLLLGRRRLASTKL
jgi:PEP-CTERM motif-containing protein